MSRYYGWIAASVSLPKSALCVCQRTIAIVLFVENAALSQNVPPVFVRSPQVRLRAAPSLGAEVVAMDVGGIPLPPEDAAGGPPGERSIAREGQLEPLPRFAETYTALLHITLAGFPDQRFASGQDMLRSRSAQEGGGLSTLHPRPSEYLRACRRSSLGRSRHFLRRRYGEQIFEQPDVIGA